MCVCLQTGTLQVDLGLISCIVDKYQTNQFMSANIDDIITPADIIRLQEEVDDAVKKESDEDIEKVMDVIMDRDPEFGMVIAIHILKALISFHEEGVDEYSKGDNKIILKMWAKDLAKIEAAYDMIKDVTL